MTITQDGDTFTVLGQAGSDPVSNLGGNRLHIEPTPTATVVAISIVGGVTLVCSGSQR